VENIGATLDYKVLFWLIDPREASSTKLGEDEDSRMAGRSDGRGKE
jgi:hypothetical protein